MAATPEQIKTQVKDLLIGDATYLGLMTGGIYHDKERISRQLTLGAFTNSRLRPCTLIKREGPTPAGPFDYSSRLFIVLYHYQEAGSGYGVISLALERANALLHRTCIAGAWDLRLADESGELFDATLDNCPMMYARYVCVFNREPAP